MSDGMTTFEKLQSWREYLKRHKAATENPFSPHYDVRTPEMFGLTTPAELKMAEMVKRQVMGC